MNTNSALKSYSDAVRRYGIRSGLARAYAERVVDAEEAAIVAGIMRRGNDSAARIARRLSYARGELPPVAEAHPK